MHSYTHDLIHVSYYVYTLKDILTHTYINMYTYIGSFLDGTKAGYLSPEIQIRNLKLFGHVTSETPYREEHDR
jgi:hypothetical protein